MKTYETWKALKMLTQNPELRFHNKQGLRMIINSIGQVVVAHEVVALKSVGAIYSCVFPVPAVEKWTLIREPVTWQEALAAWAEGKTVKCVAEKDQFIYEEKEQVFGPKNIWQGVGLEHLRCGTWFIEDGDADE